MNSWKPYLQRQARLHNMCADNRAYLSACESKSDAIRLYKQTIDWALEEQYPNLDFLKQEFSDQESQGFFVGKHFNGEVLDTHEVYVFHECKGTIKIGLNIEDSIIPMCYFANGCDMTIECFNTDNVLPIRIPLYIFGANHIISENTSQVNFKRYICKVKKGGGV